jgi:hypothetical protein
MASAQMSEECVIPILEKHDANLLYTDALYFDGKTPDNLFMQSIPKDIPCDVLSGGYRTVNYVFRFERMIPISGVAIRRSCLGGKPPFNAAYRWDPDMELLVRLSREFGVIHLKSELVAIRTHHEQAPNWKDSSFPPQYRRLLQLEQQEGHAEIHHFLVQWAASNQDMAQKLATQRVPFAVFFKFLMRWKWAELALLLHFAVHYLRKIKLLLATLLRRLINQFLG